MRFICAALSLSLAVLVTGTARAQPVVFHDARILTMDDMPMIERGWVHTDDGVIVAMGEGPAPAVEGARVIDASDKVLMPGLYDMHVHYWERGDAILYLANGITGVRNLTGGMQQARLDEAARDGSLAGPRVYGSGPIIDGDKPIRPDGSVRASNPDQAIGAVRSQHQAGFTAIKLYERLSPAAYRAAVAEAKALEMQVYSHTPIAMTVDDLLDLKIDSLEHLDGYEDVVVAADFVAQSEPFAWAEKWANADRARFAGLARKAAASGVWHVPTLALQCGQRYSASPDAFFARPETAYLAAWVETAWRSSFDSWLKRFAPYNDGQLAAKREFTAALYKAGARLLIGTDAPNAYVIPGYAIHDELAAFAEAGIANAAILRIATRDAAQFLGADDEGRLARGAKADIVMLAGDPRENLAHLKHPAGVMVAGHWYGRAVLDALLAERKAAVTQARAAMEEASAEAAKPTD